MKPRQPATTRRAVVTGAAAATVAAGVTACAAPGDGETYDFIIVGGGTSGCVLANRLSADANVRVLLLEAGGAGLSPLIHVPAAVGRVMSNPDFSWVYPAEPDASRNGRPDRYPSGKVLGGGSSINGMFFTRGQRADFDDWAALGNAGWSYADLLPYFKRSENSEIGDAKWRGKDGPVSVSHLRSVHPMSPVFLKAAEECGLPLLDDYNGEAEYGASLAQVSQKDGWRWPASRAYLWPVWSRGNLEIVTEALAQRLTFDGKTCTGVVYQAGGRTVTATARREVIVSAGAIGTPKLLMLSGIGPGAHLQQHGIAVVSDLAGVGANLQEHPDVTLSAHVTVDTYNLIALSPVRMAAAVAQWAATGKGPATSPYVQAAAFLNPLEPGARPTIEMMFAPFAFVAVDQRAEAHVRGAINFVIMLCRPSPRGRVSLRNSDARELPRIELELLADQDLPTIIAGCRFARRVIQSQAFKPFVVDERLPGPDVQSDDEWTAFIRQSTFVGNHLVGTCKMGPATDPAAVVDPADLKVRGVERLRVIDASIMPVVTSAHTNAVAFAIGEKGADLVLGRAAV